MESEKNQAEIQNPGLNLVPARLLHVKGMDSEKNQAEIQNPESESAPGMDSEKNQAEIQNPESESAPGSASSCQRLKFDEKAGFVANMQNRSSEFIHAPMDEHKACFKETFHKVIDSLDDWNCNDKFERFKSIFTFLKKD